MRPRPDLVRGLVVAAVCVGLASSLAAKEPKAPKASIEVSGLGWLHDRDQRQSLERLLGGQLGATMDGNAIEDAAFLLHSALEAEGYLQPKIEIDARNPDGGRRKFIFDATLATPMPRDLAAKAVKFNVEEGVRSVVSELEITGIHAVPMDLAREYFIPGRALFGQAAARAYTPAKLRRSLDALQDDLKRRGYAEAQVRAARVDADGPNGKVAVAVEVVEGPRWDVSAVKLAGSGSEGVSLDFLDAFVHRPWTPFWQQEVRERIRRAYYSAGYPDVTVSLAGSAGHLAGGIKPVAVMANVVPGPRVRIGEIRLEGNEHTRSSVIDRRIRPESGDWLNPIAMERARYRLSRLGVFRAVEVEYMPTDGEVRDPVYHFVEAGRTETSLLLGYGSYEQVRGGVEFRQNNLFGLAHHSRLELLQSMKSSRGEYTYTVPELFGESIDGSARIFGLQREEESFLRQEFGATVGLKKSIRRFKIEATTGYTYQTLRNEDSQLSTVVPENADVTVASLDFGLTSDHRDNPLRPRRGYRWFVQLEAASRQLGGETDYQRLESGAALHTSWGASRWIHLGATYGIITTSGAENDRLLPVNKRFYPGGESSIRGYQSGEASPRGPDGRFVGAKSYLLTNLELEQALTPNWSAVIFGDALGAAAQLSSSVFSEQLYSVGLGIRYQTLIGPVRLEYGHNVNPRTNDPSGTLHFSVGFPF